MTYQQAASAVLARDVYHAQDVLASTSMSRDGLARWRAARGALTKAETALALSTDWPTSRARAFVETTVQRGEGRRRGYLAERLNWLLTTARCFWDGGAMR